MNIKRFENTNIRTERRAEAWGHSNEIGGTRLQLIMHQWAGVARG